MKEIMMNKVKKYFYKPSSICKNKYGKQILSKTQRKTLKRITEKISKSI